MGYYTDVKDFHNKFGLETPSKFTILEPNLHLFRSKFFEEELQEYKDSALNKDLEVAIDSILDLIYIINGAVLLHGITEAKFNAARALHTRYINQSLSLIEPVGWNNPSSLQIPKEYISASFVYIMNNCINQYNLQFEQSTYHTAEENELNTMSILAQMHLNCEQFLLYFGISVDLVQNLWNDIQRANMSKERALKVSDSKRGSTYDVIKPTGWIPPQGAALIKAWEIENHLL